MIYHLHRVRGQIKKLLCPQMIEHLIVRIVDHIVRNDRRRPFGPPFVHKPPQPQPPVIIEQRIERHRFAHRCGLKESLADLLLDMFAGVSYLLHHRAVAQHIGVDRFERLLW